MRNQASAPKTDRLSIIVIEEVTRFICDQYLVYLLEILFSHIIISSLSGNYIICNFFKVIGIKNITCDR